MCLKFVKLRKGSEVAGLGFMGFGLYKERCTPTMPCSVFLRRPSAPDQSENSNLNRTKSWHLGVGFRSSFSVLGFVADTGLFIRRFYFECAPKV